MNKVAIAIAAVLTTMILLSVGGIVYAARANAANSQTPAQAGEPQLSSEREAAYQAQIEEANRRLLDAQATQQALEAELNAMQQPALDSGGASWLTGAVDDEAHAYEEHAAGRHDDEHEEHAWFGDNEDD